MTRDEVFYVLDTNGFVALDENSKPIVDKRKMEERRDLLGAFRFLFWQYKPEFWYWEVVDLVRRVILMGWLVVFDHGSTVQTILGSMFCLAFIKLYSVCEPYRHKAEAFTAEFSSWQLFSFYYIATLIRYKSFSNSREDDLDGALMTIVLFGFIMEAFDLWRRLMQRDPPHDYQVDKEEMRHIHVDSLLKQQDAYEKKLSNMPSDTKKPLQVEMTDLEKVGGGDQADEKIFQKQEVPPKNSGLFTSSSKVVPVADDEEGVGWEGKVKLNDYNGEEDDDDDVLVC